VVQRFFDPQPGDALDDAAQDASALLRVSDREILETVGIPPHVNELPCDAGKRVSASATKGKRKK
jgi:hypothetical protein